MPDDPGRRKLFNEEIGVSSEFGESMNFNESFLDKMEHEDTN